MDIHIYGNASSLATDAARAGSRAIQEAIKEKGHANIVLASAASQIQLLDNLVTASGIAWHQVRLFHLDEYVGLAITHPASFRLFLWERFIRRLPTPLLEYCLLDGAGDAAAECARVGALIREHTIDIAFIGIGENCHLAFNDPPADFMTDEPFIVVQLDEACRRQQVGEGWFPRLEDVPRQAISMSVQQIMLSRQIICTAPDARKAAAVQLAVEGEVTPHAPASRLQRHPKVALYLDEPAASRLSEATRSRCLQH